MNVYGIRAVDWLSLAVVVLVPQLIFHHNEAKRYHRRSTIWYVETLGIFGVFGLLPDN